MNDKLVEENKLLKSDNLLLTQKLKEKNKEIQNLKRKLNNVEKSSVINGQTSIFDFIK